MIPKLDRGQTGVQPRHATEKKMGWVGQTAILAERNCRGAAISARQRGRRDGKVREGEDKQRRRVFQVGSIDRRLRDGEMRR